jgi:hypothetical protein
MEVKREYVRIMREQNRPPLHIIFSQDDRISKLPMTGVSHQSRSEIQTEVSSLGVRALFLNKNENSDLYLLLARLINKL